jgi:excisionase family DNA binding protein
MAKTPNNLPPRHGEVPVDTHLPDIMIAREVAKYLRISLKSVYTMARAQQIPCTIIGKTFRFSRKKIEALI